MQAFEPHILPERPREYPGLSELRNFPTVTLLAAGLNPALSIMLRGFLQEHCIAQERC